MEQLKWQDMAGMVELDHTSSFLILAATVLHIIFAGAWYTQGKLFTHFFSP